MRLFSSYRTFLPFENLRRRQRPLTLSPLLGEEEGGKNSQPAAANGGSLVIIFSARGPAAPRANEAADYRAAGGKPPVHGYRSASRAGYPRAAPDLRPPARPLRQDATLGLRKTAPGNESPVTFFYSSTGLASRRQARRPSSGALNYLRGRGSRAEPGEASRDKAVLATRAGVRAAALCLSVNVDSRVSLPGKEDRGTVR